MNKGLVTVMIPCYNGEKYLHKCFECLKNQDYGQVQLIVVNDGSTDNSEHIILGYKKDIENKGWDFKYIYQENNGAASAINNALKSVEGEYIMLYDVDDILYDNNISEKVRVFKESSELGIVINSGYFFEEKTGIRKLFTYDKKYIEENGLFAALLYEKAYNWAGTYMVRTEFLFKQLNNGQIYVSPYGQNLQILLPVAYYHKSKIIDEPLMDYLVRADSVSHTNDINRQLELQKGFSLNRKGTIELMNIDATEKKRILQEIDVWNNRKCFIFAYNHRVIDELKRTKNNLIKHRAFTKKDRLRYVIGQNAVLKAIYDGLHRIKNRRH